MTASVVRSRFPRLARKARQWATGYMRIARQVLFYVRTIGAVGDAAINYRTEVVRLIATMGMGIGALAVIGGTVVVVGALDLVNGAFISVAGYDQFADIGIEALTGFAAAFFNTRAIIPATTAVALSATIGASATAQLGAMRINEEIDALEVMGIRSLTFLASTRLIAGFIVVVPLYCVGVLCSFQASRFSTTVLYNQAPGVYDHYFSTFLNPTDLAWSFVVSVAIAMVIMLVHTYYGYNASGGPAGVGEAVGRAVRTSLVVTAIVVTMMVLTIYGQTGDFHFTG